MADRSQLFADTWAGFCERIDGVSHSVVEQWRSGSGTVVEADVTYTRKDGGTVTVPVATIYRERDGEIADYRIFTDLAPLFAWADPGGLPAYPKTGGPSCRIPRGI